MIKLLEKKIIVLVVVISFLITNIVGAQAPIIDDAPEPDPNIVYPEVTADNLEDMTGTAAVVMDQASGRIIFAKNENTPHYPASTTKILTALMAIESDDLNKVIEVDERAVGEDGSAIYISEGDELTLKDLIQSTMLASGNDGAEALAYYLGHGSMEEFLQKMNERAEALGAKNTHFNNPHGLPDKEHYSTALDLALIARYAMFNPIFREVVGKKQAVIRWQHPEERESEYFNTNRLLWNYDDVNGVKTGYTEEAGGCLVASAQQGDTSLISVVLQTIDSRSRFSESRALLDYGFKAIKSRVSIPKEKLMDKVFVHGGTVARVEVEPIAEFSYPLLEGEEEKDFSYELSLPKFVEAPVNKGDVVGKILLYKKGVLVGSMPLVAAEGAVKGFNIWGYLHSLIFHKV